jgi:hypothetical protein
VTPQSRVAAGTLDGLDAWGGDSIGLFLFSDQKPLAGVAGFVDWRACGALSRTLENAMFKAGRGESMLLPTRMRAAFRRIFVFGLGATQECDEGIYRNELRKAARIMRDAGVTDLAIAAPASRKQKGVELTFVKAAASAVAHELHVIFVEQPTDEMSSLFAAKGVAS